MKTAVINMQIVIHEVKDGEMRDVTPKDVMEDKGVKQNMIVKLSADNEELICKKIREWLCLAH